MNHLIEEANVNAFNLSLELERAVIEHRLQDDEKLYVTGDGYFPFWIHILKKQRYIGFATYVMFRESTTALQRLELANQFNKDTYLSSAHVDMDMLKINHVLTYRNGILTETLIRGCRQFSAGIELFITESDPDYQVLMRLSESSSSETNNE